MEIHLRRILVLLRLLWRNMKPHIILAGQRAGRACCQNLTNSSPIYTDLTWKTEFRFCKVCGAKHTKVKLDPGTINGIFP